MSEESETERGARSPAPRHRRGPKFTALHLSGIILLAGIGMVSHATVAFRSGPGPDSPADLARPSRILDPEMVVLHGRAGRGAGPGAGSDLVRPRPAANDGTAGVPVPERRAAANLAAGMPPGDRPEDDRDLARKPDPGLAAFLDILPGAVIIPTAEPDMSHAKTVADVAGGDAGQPVAGYVLGEDGMSPEMEAAFRVIQRGRAPATVHEDANVFREAAAEIGYVPAGVDPNSIRTPGAELGAVGEVLQGPVEVISGHSLAIGGEMLRLQGARAPGAMDVCLNAAGAEYDCASWSRAGMEHILEDREIACEITGETHPEGGRIGWCNLDVGSQARDLAELAVRAGILVPDRGDDGFSPYDGDERDAQTSGFGVWSGSFSLRNQ